MQNWPFALTYRPHTCNTMVPVPYRSVVVLWRVDTGTVFLHPVGTSGRLRKEYFPHSTAVPYRPECPAYRLERAWVQGLGWARMGLGWARMAQKPNHGPKAHSSPCCVVPRFARGKSKWWACPSARSGSGFWRRLCRERAQRLGKFPSPTKRGTAGGPWGHTMG